MNITLLSCDAFFTAQEEGRREAAMQKGGDLQLLFDAIRGCDKGNDGGRHRQALVVRMIDAAA